MDEHLATYGWVLLAIGIVVAVLVAWGAFDPSTGPGGQVVDEAGLDVIRDLERVDRSPAAFCEPYGDDAAQKYRCCSPVQQDAVNATVLQCHTYEFELRNGSYLFTVVR